MADISKLSKLLDDPEVRVVVFGLAHTAAVSPTTPSGASRLRAAVLRLGETTTADQYQTWLSDDARNSPMTAEQVRAAFGDDAIDDLARYAQGSPADVAWQLAAILPDLVDALSPSGTLIEAAPLAQALREASAAGDRSAGPFGPHLH